MDVSIIIVSRDTKSLTLACLASIFSTLIHSKLRSEVIVVDNNSTDGTVKAIQEKFPTVQILRNPENVGFGRANNQGIKKAKGEHILLLNSDTETLSGAVESLYDFSKGHPKAFIGAKLFNPNMSPQTSCGPFFTLPMVFAILFLKGDKIGLTRWSPDTVSSVDWVSGACIMSKRTNFMDSLLFDEGVFMYMEEIDLFMRAKKRGYEVLFFPEAKVIHVGSGSSTNRKKGPILNIYKGFLWLYKKHYGGWETWAVKGMLQFKAILGIVVGTVLGNKEMKETYAEAFRMV